MLEQNTHVERIVREKEAAGMLGISASTLRRIERRHEIAPRRVITANTRGWLLSEIQRFAASRQPVTPAKEAHHQ